MDYRKEMETLLNYLKKLKHSRRMIEKALGYTPNYLDQALSKGGNEKVLNQLKSYKERVEGGDISDLIFNDSGGDYKKGSTGKVFDKLWNVIEKQAETIKSQQETIHFLTTNVGNANTRSVHSE
jgi:hypothetical protein